MKKALWRSFLFAGSVLLGAGCGSEVTGGGAGGAGGTGGTGANNTTSTQGTGGTGGTGSACATDNDCAASMEWCVNGACAPCDNSAPLCDIACMDGWNTYERNGCLPCACAPVNDCMIDADCTNGPGECYAGSFCWDWCPPGDPTCCFGNLCSVPGCPDPHPVGCFSRGCPAGQDCTSSGCSPSSCGCDGNGGWVCTDDCGGGTCAP
jgi:hypothetical protein